MNQILQVQEDRRKSNSNPIDTKKIVLFFAVCLIIFGVVLLGEGAYSVYKNNSNKKVTPSTPVGSGSVQEPEYIAPIITFTKTEDDKLVINIESQTSISHIIYNWNTNVATTLDETGKTNIEEIVDIPSGENTIYLSVVDSNGIETKKQETYTIEQTKPVIEFISAGNNIKVVVTSEVELSYVTYKWNSEEEQKNDMLTFENRKKFEKELEIPKGQNTLKIEAVDINGNKSEKSQQIKGVAKLKDPKVTVSGEYLSFVFEAEDNMKTVEFTFNGQTYYMNTDTFGTTKTVKYKLKLVNGWNYLKLIGTTENDAQNTTIWKWEYKAQ